MRELYEKVFDTNGDIKACGRDACKKLIKACQEIQPNVDFGNVDTGMMHVENIKNLYRKNK